MSACPACRVFHSKVVDSRKQMHNGWVMRRRHCLECGERWTTFEIAEDDIRVTPPPPPPDPDSDD